MFNEIKSLIRLIENNVTEILSSCFGLNIDGRSHKSEQLIPVIPVYHDMKMNKKKELLLAFALQLTEAHLSVSHTAEFLHATSQI